MDRVRAIVTESNIPLSNIPRRGHGECKLGTGIQRQMQPTRSWCCSTVILALQQRDRMLHL